MNLFSDEACLGYEQPGHPERPARIADTLLHLEGSTLPLKRREFEEADGDALLQAHSAEHVKRLEAPRDFDLDTPYFDGISRLAKLGTGAAMAAMRSALDGEAGFSLMRPPGHHAERSQAMGFCYLNHVAVCALQALKLGLERIAVWDFDAHHGNGTEAILKGVDGVHYASVHQHPCYPGTGLESEANCFNFPVPPYTPGSEHMDILEQSLMALLEFQPQLVLVSAGFDAYELDPITEMRLSKENFETLGSWIKESTVPTAAILEGGYSDDLPVLVENFLKGWIEP